MLYVCGCVCVCICSSVSGWTVAKPMMKSLYCYQYLSTLTTYYGGINLHRSLSSCYLYLLMGCST